MELQARKLTKSWGATHVLRGIDMRLDGGSVSALIGANGAGKTTLIRILATIIRQDDGEASLDGFNLHTQTLKARARIGYLGHESMLDPALTMRENLNLFGRLYGTADPQGRAAELIERFEAGAFADVMISELSRGQEQRAGLCRALMHSPGLLLLDEPSTGLDREARARLWTVAREHADTGAIVLFSTHDHDSAQSTADRVLELADGTLS